MKIATLISALILPITIYARDYMFDALESTNFGEGGYGSGGFGLGNLVLWILGAIILVEVGVRVYGFLNKNAEEIWNIWGFIRNIIGFFILFPLVCLGIVMFFGEYVPDVVLHFIGGVFKFYGSLINGK